MAFLREVARFELAGLVVCFATVLGWKMLRGAVRRVRHPETRTTLPRGMTGALLLQMPAASLVVALLYLARLPQSAASGSLPAVPDYALALLAGSQAAFLAVMARRLLRPFSISKNEGDK